MFERGITRTHRLTLDKEFSSSSVIRFRLKSLLIAMVIFSVFFGIVGMVLRRMPDPQKMELLRALALFGGSVFVTLSAHIIHRRHIEKKAGRRYYAFTSRRRKSALRRLVWRTFFLVFFCFVLHRFVAYSFLFKEILFLPLFLLSMGAGVYVALVLLMLWWNGMFGSIEICECGIVLDRGRMIPWEMTFLKDWDPKLGKLELEFSSDTSIRLYFPSKEVAVIDELVLSHFADRLNILRLAKEGPLREERFPDALKTWLAKGWQEAPASDGVDRDA